MDDDIIKNAEVIAHQIKRYLHTHPMSSDTIDGIAFWWLKKQQFNDSRALVGAALSLLEEDKIICKEQRNSLTYYKLINQDREKA